jgi:hypothetical protein
VIRQLRVVTWQAHENDGMVFKPGMVVMWLVAAASWVRQPGRVFQTPFANGSATTPNACRHLASKARLPADGGKTASFKVYEAIVFTEGEFK